MQWKHWEMCCRGPHCGSSWQDPIGDINWNNKQIDTHMIITFPENNRPLVENIRRLLSAYEFIQRRSKNLFYYNFSYWILSQVFCSDNVLIFPVINSVSNRISSLLVLHPIICFLDRFIWSKTPLLSLLGLIYRLSIYNKKTATIQYRIIFFP